MNALDSLQRDPLSTLMPIPGAFQQEFDLGKKHLQTVVASSSVLGVFRSVMVHTAISPLEVIKANQQTKYPDASGFAVARTLYNEKGLSSFYRGLRSKLMASSLKQVWSWPMITGMPHALDNHGVHDPYLQQLLTGQGIAATDALLLTPLEKRRVKAILKNKSTFSFRDITHGWCGGAAHLKKLSVNWSTFLVGQKYFREKEYEKTGKRELTLPQLLLLGTKTACVVSVFSAPFDKRHTWSMVHDGKITSKFSGNVVRNMFIGCPTNTVILIVHNVASLTLLHYLDGKAETKTKKVTETTK